MRESSSEGPLLVMKSGDEMLAEIERVASIQIPVIRNATCGSRNTITR
jgi:hypothetical protein